MSHFALFDCAVFFADGQFLTKVKDEWIGDLQEFLHTKLPHLVVVIVVAIILSRLIVALTDRIIHMADRKDARPGRHSQVRTFTSILKNTLVAILWGLTAVQVLQILGVNLGPLLASAGIAGVAIGLAAQTIVKDMLNGMLIVLEDQFNVGDVVRITGMTGTVETMTLRRTEVRDGDGTLYVVPNSQITTVANLSRDFSVATVNVSVDFSASPDKVIKLLTDTAMEIAKDKAYAGDMLADPQVLGVDSVKGSEVIYPVIFKTQANKQYGAIREFRRRVRIALEQQGMLPGDPTRTFRDFGDGPRQLEGSTQARPVAEQPQAHQDPTTVKPHETNPFTGE